MKYIAAFVAALLAAAGAHASCYTVMGAKGETLSQSPNPPVDMSQQLHETVPVKYGSSATMVFGIADDNCGNPVDASQDSAEPNAPAAQAGAAQPVKHTARKHRRKKK
jgi:hypothetical protein